MTALQLQVDESPSLLEALAELQARLPLLGAGLAQRAVELIERSGSPAGGAAGACHCAGDPPTPRSESDSFSIASLVR